jgi:hypothetical protein
MKRRRADYIADAVRQKVDANRQRAMDATQHDDRERQAIRAINLTLKEKKRCGTK